MYNKSAAHVRQIPLLDFVHAALISTLSAVPIELVSPIVDQAPLELY